MDKLQQVYDLYLSQGLLSDNISFEQFSAADEDQQNKLYTLGKEKGLFSSTGADTFKSAWGSQSFQTDPVKETASAGSKNQAVSMVSESENGSSVSQKAIKAGFDAEEAKNLQDYYDRYAAINKIDQNKINEINETVSNIDFTEKSFTTEEFQFGEFMAKGFGEFKDLVQPKYAKQLKEAEKELKALGQTPSTAEIENFAKQKIKQELVQEEIGKAREEMMEDLKGDMYGVTDWLVDIATSKFDIFDLDILKSDYEKGREIISNTYTENQEQAVKEYDSLSAQLELNTVEAKKSISQLNEYDKIKKQGGELSFGQQEDYNRHVDLIRGFQKNSDKQIEKLQSLSENITNFQELADLSKRSYSNYDIIRGTINSRLVSIGASGLELAAGLTDADILERSGVDVSDAEQLKIYPEFLRPMMAEILPYGKKASEKLRQGADWLYDEADKITSGIQKRQEFDKIDSIEDFFEFTQTLFAEQGVNTAITLALPNVGLAAISASSAGDKWHTMRIEEKKTGKKYTPAQWYGSAVASFAAEYLTEKISLSQATKALKYNYKKAFDVNPRYTLDINKMKATTALGNWAKSVAAEGGAEFAAQFINNVSDKYLLDKDISLTDGLTESFFSGAIMSGLGFSSPVLASELMQSFMTDKAMLANNARIKEILNITKEIDELSLRIDSDPSAVESIKILQERQDQLIQEQHESIIKGNEMLDSMSDSDKRSLLKIDTAMYKLKAAIDRINKDPNLSEDQKKSLIQSKAKLIEVLNAKKQSTLKNTEYSKNRQEAYVLRQKLIAENGLEDTVQIIEAEDGEDAINKTKEAINKSDLDPEVKKALIEQLDLESAEIGIQNGFTIGVEQGLPIMVALKNNATNGAFGDSTVFTHEIAHGTLFAKLIKQGADVVAMGQMLEQWARKNVKGSNEIFDNVYELYGDLLNKDSEKYDPRTFAEELFAALSTAYRKSGDKPNLTLMGKLLKAWNKLKGNDKRSDNEIKTGEDVFNLMLSYNSAFKTGEITGSFKALIKGRLKTVKAETAQKVKEGTIKMSKITPSQQEMNNRVDNLVGKKDANGNYTWNSKEEFQMSEEFANTYEQIIGGNLIDPLITRGIEGDSVYGISIEDFVEKVKSEGNQNITQLLINFDPTKNNSLIGYINSQLGFRKGDVLNRLKAQQPKQAKSIDTAAGEAGAVTGAEMMSTEEADAGIEIQERAAKESAEIKPPIKNRLKLKNKKSVVDKIKEKLAKAVKYKISLFDAAAGRNQTVTNFVRDIHRDLQEAAYEILLEAMNVSNVEEFRGFLRDNYISILDGLTTTYLSKAFPEAIKKKIVGEGWVNYPQWKGKKRGAKKGDVEFYKANDPDDIFKEYLGSTSGPQKIRRIKNIGNTITPQVFEGKYIKGDEVVQRAVDALAKQLAAEMGIDILMEELRVGGSIAESLFDRQELIRGAATEMAVNEVIRQLERPTIKFSSKQAVTGQKVTDDARKALDKYVKEKGASYIDKVMAGTITDLKFNELVEALIKAFIVYFNTARGKKLTKKQAATRRELKKLGFSTPGSVIDAIIRKYKYDLTAAVKELDENSKDIKSTDFSYDKEVKAKREKYIATMQNTAIKHFYNILKTSKDVNGDIQKWLNLNAGSWIYKAYLNNKDFFNNFLIPTLEDLKKQGYDVDPADYTLQKVLGGESLFYKGEKILTIYTQEAGAADIAPILNNKSESIPNSLNIEGRNKQAEELQQSYMEYAKWLRDAYIRGEISILDILRNAQALHSGYMRAGGKALAKLDGLLLYEGLYDKKDYTYEHNPPSNVLKILFVMHTLGAVDTSVLQNLVKNSTAFIMPTKMAKIIDKIMKSSLSRKFKWDDGGDSILENRYFFPQVQEALRNAGWDLSADAIQDVNSKNFVRSPRSPKSKATIKYSLDTRLDDNGKPVYFYPDYADNEDLDSPVVEWSSDLFKVGPLEPNQYYSIDMGVLRGKKGGRGVDVMFRLIETKSGSSNLGADSKLNITNQFKDNSKTPLKVFSIVGNALLDFIKENPNYDFIMFSGTDVSRIRLYDRLGRMLAQELGWEFKVTREVYTERRDGIPFDKEVSEYLVTKPANIKYSKADKQKQQLINNNNNLLPANQRLDAKNVSNQDVLRKMKGLDKKEAEIRFSKINPEMLNKQFNVMLEQTTGIKSESEYSEARAKMDGKLSGKKWWFIPPTAQDFMGLMYAFVAKGKTGDAQLKWIQRNLINPYARAAQEITRARRAMYRDYDALKKQLKIVPKDLKEKIPGSSFTVQHAVRAYIFTQEGHEIPGLTEKEARELKQYVQERPELIEFAEKIRSLLKGTQMAKPGKNWTGGTITTDLLETLNTTKRAEALAEWQANVDAIFSKENLNKIEALYGSNFKWALENILTRMRTGRNKNYGPDSQVGKWMDWLNSQTGTIMFFNMRSAVLQTISTINFMNWSDNNPLEAAKAFANQKQYWTDFFMLFNSDFLVDRRDGLKMEVNESDIADMAKEGMSFQAIVNKVLKAGFVPTQIADSFAIAAGGAAFYRNRLNRYIKEGMEPDKAAEQAFMDFRETAEESQQSSRPDKISAQQAGNLGRFILAFANTPAQYARLMNRAYLDLKNGRGDAKTNISKIIYYGVAQNLLFNALQQALFAFAFDEDEEEEKEKNEKYLGIANGMFDSVLRGIGVHGAIIATLKNTAIALYKESGKDLYKQELGKQAVIGLSGIAPPLNSKIRKLYKAGDIYKYNNKEIQEMGWDIDNPALLAAANVISSVSNLPTDRMVQKSININDALTEDITTMQRLALFAGWSGWNLKIPKYDRTSQSSSSRGKGFNRKRRGFKPRKF